MKRPKRPTRTSNVGKELGFRSGLEERIAAELKAAGVDASYESVKIDYVKPEKKAKYTPDWLLPNGIYIETKGRFVTADRQKHLLIQNQHPEIDIRFVFSNSKARISKLSQTTYGDWCNKHGFKFADKHIPNSWLNE